MLNIVCTSKPVDGLLYYSYEYASYLNTLGIDTRLVIIPHRKFNQHDYLDAISKKYIHCKNVMFDIIVSPEDITLVMGRSMITLSWLNFRDYKPNEQQLLRTLFSNKIISVYSENHPVDYLKALDFYSPSQIVDLCDYDVYPNGVGDHFEKHINFDIYRQFELNIQFKYLFMGTNDKYYASAENALQNFSDYGILTYNDKYINTNNNNIFVPIDNLLGIFDTYVYTKETFDPAPRIIQECKYYDKPIIYFRDKSIIDGGSVYYSRPIKKIDATPILTAIL